MYTTSTEFAHADRVTVAAPSARAMQRLLRAVRDLASARDQQEIVDIVRHAARELVDADGATFVLRDHDQCFYVDEDAIEPLWRGQRFPLEACISGWAMLNAEQVRIPDIYLDARIPHDAYRPTFVHSLVMTPIRSGDPVGSIGTYWAQEHHATPPELELLQALADSTAVAMESVRTVRELERRVADRTQELTATVRDLEAFAHVAAHDLKAPLGTIAAYAEQIADLDAEQLSVEGTQALDAVHRQALRMSGLIDAVLTYSAAATTPLTQRPVDLAAMAAEVLDDLGPLVAGRGARVTVDVRAEVRCAPELVELVLQNLVVNAVTYGDPVAPEVTIVARQHDEQVVLTVSDNGPGVAPAERELIFSMFSRGAAATRVSGSGIGLAFARRVADRHNGSLVVDDDPGGGARFTLTLPQ